MNRAGDLAAVAIDRGYLTVAQVGAARDEQARVERTRKRRPFLAEVLVKQGALTYDRLVALLELCRGYHETSRQEQPEALFGDIAVRKGYVAPIELFLGLEQQRDDAEAGRERRPIGEILVDRGWLSPWELEDVLVTKADLGYSNRTGETPSDALPVGRRLFADPPSRAPRVAKPRARVPVVREVMRRPFTTTPDTLLGDAFDLAQENDTDFLLVTDRGELVGVLRARDASDAGRRVPVSRHMTSPALTVHADTPLAEVAPVLRQHDLPCIAVLSRGRIVGVVTQQDLTLAGFPRPQKDETPLPYKELGSGD